MTGFEGFLDADGKFFKALARNNERDWFLAHKPEFERGWQAPMKLLLADVRDGIERVYKGVELDEPKVFRIFRDVRFSKDKTPYKTHIGGYIPLMRRTKTATDLPMALYFHVGGKEKFAAAGHYMMQPESLERFRAAVAHDKRGKELEKLLAALEKKGYAPDSHDSYKRVPRGYDPEHPRAEHLKRKGLTVSFPDMPKGILASPKLVQWLIRGCKTSAPLVQWLIAATAQ